jgi:hypothetical protein
MRSKAATVLGLSSLLLAACQSVTPPSSLVDGSTADPGVDAAQQPAADAGIDAIPAQPAVPTRVFEVIDDLDHADGGEMGFLCPVGLCSWFTRPVDAAGVSTGAVLAPPSPPRGASKKAWHLRTGPDSAGVDVRLDIHGPQFPRVLYPDLRNYAGVAFWARGDAENQDLLVAMEDDKVIAPNYSEAAAGRNPWFTQPVKVGTEWRRYILLFDDFQQVDAKGSVVSTGQLDTAAVWSIHFIAGLARRAGGVWVDDLALLCKGPCLVPPYDLPATSTASGLRDEELRWTPSSSTDADLRCAELAALSMTPADQWVAGAAQRVFLRARVAADPNAAVPLWGWTVEKLPDGTRLPVTTLDEGDTLVSVPVAEPGQYRVRAHTHYPGMAACGVEIVATAAAR